MYAIIVPQLPPGHYHSSAGRVRGSSCGAQFISLSGQRSLAVLTPFPWLFRLSFLTYLFCTNLRLVLLRINSDQPCSVQARACTRNLQTEVGLPLIFFLFYFIYYHPMYHNNIIIFLLCNMYSIFHYPGLGRYLKVFFYNSM